MMCRTLVTWVLFLSSDPARTPTSSPPSLSRTPALSPPPPAPPFSSPPSFSSASLTISTSFSPVSYSSSPALRPRLCLRPLPSPIRRPLPQHWIHSSGTSTTSTTSILLNPLTAPDSTPISLSINHDLDLRLLHVLANHLNGGYRPLSRPRQRVPFSISAPCSPFSRPLTQQKLVFASGAVGTASALGHVFGRPLQARETVACAPENCTQLPTELQHSLAQKAQSPSHTFQQQCSVHKRFRLFRQRPRKCPVHSMTAGGPNFIMPPTTVHPLVVRPEKILLDKYEDPAVQVHVQTQTQSASWKRTMTPSASTSSKLSSYSSVSLSLSSTFGQGSDGESHGSGSFQMSRKKKFSYKEQQQPQLRCLCYLDVTLDQQQQQEQRQYQHQHQHQHQRQHEAPQQTKTRLLSTPSWYPKKHQKEASRLRRIWNDSTIFHWSKPSGTSRRGQLSQEEQSMQGSQQQHTVGAAESLFVQNSGLEGAPMRNSLSGTDISDEGNHTLTDVEDDCDDEDESTSSTNSGSRPQRVPLQEHFGTKPTTRTARPGDDLKAISRHQAELNQEPGRLDYNDYLMEDQPPQQEGRPLATSFAAGEVLDEDDDDDEDWDIQSDSGAPSSSPMYSAEAREPTSYSTVTLPLSQQTTTTPMAKGGYMKKPSNANLNSLRSRQRCLSLPADAGHRGFYKMSSRPSENWDEDFDIEEADINVPTNVVESQISLQMDIYNIKDFALQIEDLKTLRTSLRMASNSLKATNPKKHQDLSMLFQRDWEQAEVIIDLGEIAQTSTSPSPLPSLSSTSGTTGPAMAAGPLSAKKSSQHLQQLQSASSIGKATSQGLRRPALSTTTGPTIASSMPSHMALATALTTTAETRSISQSSTLVDSEEMRSVTSSRSSSGLTTIGVEPATEGWAIGGERRRPNLGAAVAPLKKQGSKMVMTESFSNSSSVLGVECTTPATPLPGYLENQNQDQSQDEAGEKWKVMSSGNGVAAEIEASFRRYQKYSGRHSHPKGRSSSSGNRSRIPSYDDEYEEDDDDDDGYESYGYGGNSASSQSSSSVGVITPIPSDRHMQVLKDILMEGLGRDVARQYMFKHGEQDHVRFSVEVIPGLLGHLKGLQQRLGDQLMELQALTIVA